jgi:hypothetical protein
MRICVGFGRNGGDFGEFLLEFIQMWLEICRIPLELSPDLLELSPVPLVPSLDPLVPSHFSLNFNSHLSARSSLSHPPSLPR